MRPTAGVDLSLRARAGGNFVRVVTGFVENSALAFGLTQDQALDLMLAAEEVFVHLCRVVLPDGSPLEVRAASGGYFVQIDFIYPAADFNMRSFNITATVSPADDSSIDEMGLVLASRSVDRIAVQREGGSWMRLTLMKEKAYPAPDAQRPLPPRLVTSFQVRPPGAEELKLAAHLIGSCYQEQVYPAFFNFPGKLVDMVGLGDYCARAAIGPTGELVGLVVWHPVSGATVECFGPYLFHQDTTLGMADALVESCIEAVARGRAVGLVNLYPTTDFPRQHFESLGEILTCTQDGSCTRLGAWFRLLHEDAGDTVWVHPELEAFVTGQYHRLVLPREVRLARHEGESRGPHSVLSAEFGRLQQRVMLRAMWAGEDLETNLAQHLRLFHQEGLPNVFFSMDLGQSWQVDCTGPLLRNGFEPRLLVPYAGDGDVVMFQLRHGAGTS